MVGMSDPHLLHETHSQSKFLTGTMAENYKTIAERKQAERQSRIPKEWLLKSLPSLDKVNVEDIPRSCGVLSVSELKITEQYDATALAQAIASGELKCVDVTRAYCKVSEPGTLYQSNIMF